MIVAIATTTTTTTSMPSAPPSLFGLDKACSKLPEFAIVAAKSVQQELHNMEKEAQACIRGTGRFNANISDANDLVSRPSVYVFLFLKSMGFQSL